MDDSPGLFSEGNDANVGEVAPSSTSLDNLRDILDGVSLVMAVADAGVGGGVDGTERPSKDLLRSDSRGIFISSIVGT